MKKFSSCLCINPHILNKICENAYIYMYIVLNFVYESIHTSIFLECMYIYVSCRTPCSLATMLEKKDHNFCMWFLYAHVCTYQIYFLSNSFCVCMQIHILLHSLITGTSVETNWLKVITICCMYMYLSFVSYSLLTGTHAWGEKMKTLK